MGKMYVGKMQTQKKAGNTSERAGNSDSVEWFGSSASRRAHTPDWYTLARS